MRWEIKCNFGTIWKTFEKLNKRVKDIRPALQEIGEGIVSLTQKRIKEGVPPPNAPLTRAYKKGNNTPLRDTGRLMSSITYRVYSDAVLIGTNVKYAPIQQFGGTITPKQAKKLAIPASWETRTLMRRYGFSVRACLDGLKNSGWQIWFTDGAIMGKLKKNKKSKGKVLFIRKESVTIPSRPFLVIEEEEKKFITEVFKDWFNG